MTIYANILLLLVFVPFFAGQEKGQEGGVPHLNPTGFMFKRPLIYNSTLEYLSIEVLYRQSCQHLDLNRLGDPFFKGNNKWDPGFQKSLSL